MRVISLVPSLTLTLADLGLDASQLVGRTPWCIHPESFVKDVKVMGGTKTPNINKLRDARPDLVILDREENPKDVYEALNEAGIETFVSEVEHPSDVPEMLIQLGDRLNLEAKANELATSIQQELEGIPQQEGPIVLPMI